MEEVGHCWLGKYNKPLGCPQAGWGPWGPRDLETPTRSESSAGANPGQLFRTLVLPNFQEPGTPASHDVPPGLICSANGLLAVPSSLGSQVSMLQASNPCPQFHISSLLIDTLPMWNYREAILAIKACSHCFTGETVQPRKVK